MKFCTIRVTRIKVLNMLYSGTKPVGIDTNRAKAANLGKIRSGTSLGSDNVAAPIGSRNMMISSRGTTGTNLRRDLGQRRSYDFQGTRTVLDLGGVLEDRLRAEQRRLSLGRADQNYVPPPLQDSGFRNFLHSDPRNMSRCEFNSLPEAHQQALVSEYHASTSQASLGAPGNGNGNGNGNGLGPGLSVAQMWRKPGFQRFMQMKGMNRAVFEQQLPRETQMEYFANFNNLSLGQRGNRRNRGNGSGRGNGRNGGGNRGNGSGRGNGGGLGGGNGGGNGGNGGGFDGSNGGGNGGFGGGNGGFGGGNGGFGGGNGGNGGGNGGNGGGNGGFGGGNGGNGGGNGGFGGGNGGFGGGNGGNGGGNGGNGGGNGGNGGGNGQGQQGERHVPPQLRGNALPHVRRLHAQWLAHGFQKFLAHENPHLYPSNQQGYDNWRNTDGGHRSGLWQKWPGSQQADEQANGGGQQQQGPLGAIRQALGCVSSSNLLLLGGAAFLLYQMTKKEDGDSR